MDKIAGFCSGSVGIDIELLFGRRMGDIVGRGISLCIGFCVEYGMGSGLLRMTRFFLIDLYAPTPMTHRPIPPKILPMSIELDRIPVCSSCAEIDSARAAAANTGRKSVAVLVAVAVALPDEEPDPVPEPDGLVEGEEDDDCVA